MPQNEETVAGDQEVDEEVTCDEQHVADLTEESKRFLTIHSTIRSKIDDLARADSDIKRFELSIETERKRLKKQQEAALTSLKNARIQMGAELAKLDEAGFAQYLKIVKDQNAVS